MHVPFSMSDEPDLGDEFKGYLIDNHEGDYQWEPKSETLVRMYTQAEVDDAIRKLITKHQQSIDSLRLELLDAKERVEELEDYIQDLHYYRAMEEL